MCDPVTLAVASFAVSTAGSVAKYEGDVSATNAANAQAAAAHRNAGIAAEQQYEDAQRKFIYDSRANQQKGFEAAQAGRSAISQGIAAAGASGIDAGSISVGDILNEQRRQTAQNMQNVAFRQSDLTGAFVSDTKAIQQQAQGRIDSTPFQSGPSMLNLAIDVAGSGIKLAKDLKN